MLQAKNSEDSAVRAYRKGISYENFWHFLRQVYTSISSTKNRRTGNQHYNAMEHTQCVANMRCVVAGTGTRATDVP